MSETLSPNITIWLNGGLLFVVVSYIYPLKFLFAGIVGPDGMRFGQGSTFMRLDQAKMLMVVYGVGFAAIFLLFAAMYWRAARRTVEPVKRHDARVLIGHSFVYVGVAAMSMALAVFGGPYGTAYSGLSYGLIGPFQGLYHGLTARYWKAPVSSADVAAAERGSIATSLPPEDQAVTPGHPGSAPD